MATQNGNLIRQLIRVIDLKGQRLLSEQLKTTALTQQQLLTIQFIHHRPGIIQQDLVLALKRRAATISVALKTLENADLITRTVPDDNTRNKQLFLTQKGRLIAEQLDKAQQVVSEQLISNLSESDQQDLISLLEKIK